jgi:hypothetical protein
MAAAVRSYSQLSSASSSFNLLWRSPLHRAGPSMHVARCCDQHARTFSFVEFRKEKEKKPSLKKKH